MDKHKLIENLLDLDEEAYFLFSDDEGIVQQRFEVIVVGSSSLILKDLIARGTRDTDILRAPRQLVPLLEKYNMNMRVVSYLDSFPYNYEDRLTLLPIAGRIIDFYSPAVEDLIVSKLYRNESHDLEDFQSIFDAVSVDWHILDELVYDDNEAKAAMSISRRYEEMVNSYESLKEACQQ